MSQGDAEDTRRQHELELLRMRLRTEGLRTERDALRRHADALEAEIGQLRKELGFLGSLSSLAAKLWKSTRELNPQNSSPELKPRPRPGDHRPSIAVIVDTIDWSFANIARQMQRFLSDEFTIEIISTVELDHDAVLAFQLARNFDLIHFMWRESIFEAYNYLPNSVLLYFGSVEMMKVAVSQKTTFTVYDHLFTREGDIEIRRDMFNEYAGAYAVCSEKLYEIYSKRREIRAPSGLVQDGVDLDLFRPVNLSRLKNLGHRPLRVGWVGNSECANDVYADLKGFQTILEPAVRQGLSEGLNLERVYADSQESVTPHLKMPDFYSKIDVLICTSAIEGTPNPVLEAMACGVPVISTDVGVVPEVFGELQKRFILEERTPRHLKEAIASLCHEPDLLVRLSEENQVRIRSWDWAKRIEKYRMFFRQSLRRAS